MKRVTCCLIVVLIVSFSFFSPTPSYAGFMDKLNAATQKINQATQKIQQKSQSQTSSSTSKPPAGEDPDRPLHLEDYDKTGSCEGKRSATCMDYMELASNCMAPLKGYRAKLYAEQIDKKLKTENLSGQQRKNLEEDLAAFKEAQNNKTDEPTIAGQKNSQRYLQDVSEEDQVYVNAEYNKFYKKIYNKCMGADHMGIGKRTEMMQDTETISGEEAVAQLRQKKSKESAPFDCLKKLSNLRWKIMADMMESKMNRLNPSGKEREAWEADIASIRDVAQTGAPAPTPADPSNPARYMLRLDSNEQVAMMQEYARQNEIESAKCTSMSARMEERDYTQSGGLVDKSKSPANKKAAKQKVKEYTQEELNYGRGGSTNLLGLRRDKGCADAIKGHLAKVTADTLEAKLNQAGNISAQKQTEWQEDIAAFRAAEAAGLDSPEPPDPSNPYRWYDYVTKAERAQINKQHADFAAKITRDCGNRKVKELD